MAATGVRKQQAAQTGADLKAAAVRVFARVGYLNAKITDSTAEAGRATGLFYQHFAGKEKLLQALLADLLAEGDASAEQPGHGTDFADRTAVRYHVAVYWEFYRRHRTVMDALRQAAIVDPEFARVADEMMEPDLRHIADHLKGLPGDPLAMASLFTATLSAAVTAWQDRGIPDQEAIEALTTFMWRGLAGT